VVLFGEGLHKEKMDRLRKESNAGFDVVFTVGTSSLFPYIAEPVSRARSWGIPTVEINPEPTEVSSRVDIRIGGRAADVLDRIWRQFLGS
jgi:NAD-dependent deacetylase